MIAVPAETPVTTPVATEATEGALLVQVPPVAAVSVIVLPTHTRVGPAIGAPVKADGRCTNVNVLSPQPRATAVKV